LTIANGGLVGATLFARASPSGETGIININAAQENSPGAPGIWTLPPA